MGENKNNPGENSFKERLARARKETEDEWQEEAPASPMGIAFKMGIELVVGSGVGAFMGYWFDKWLDTAPLFIVALLILGFAGGVRNVIRDARQLQDAEEKTDKS